MGQYLRHTCQLSTLWTFPASHCWYFKNPLFISWSSLFHWNNIKYTCWVPRLAHKSLFSPFQKSPTPMSVGSDVKGVKLVGKRICQAEGTRQSKWPVPPGLSLLEAFWEGGPKKVQTVQFFRTRKRFSFIILNSWFFLTWPKIFTSRNIPKEFPVCSVGPKYNTFAMKRGTSTVRVKNPTK